MIVYGVGGCLHPRITGGMVVKVMGIINYVSYMAHGPHDIDVLSGHHMSYCVVIWPLWWTTTPVLDASAMS